MNIFSQFEKRSNTNVFEAFVPRDKEKEEEEEKKVRERDLLKTSTDMAQRPEYKDILETASGRRKSAAELTETPTPVSPPTPQKPKTDFERDMYARHVEKTLHQQKTRDSKPQQQAETKAPAFEYDPALRESYGIKSPTTTLPKSDFEYDPALRERLDPFANYKKWADTFYISQKDESLESETKPQLTFGGKTIKAVEAGAVGIGRGANNFAKIIFNDLTKSVPSIPGMEANLKKQAELKSTATAFGSFLPNELEKSINAFFDRNDKVLGDIIKEKGESYMAGSTNAEQYFFGAITAATQMIPTIAASLATGGASLFSMIPFMATAAGNYYGDAKEKGMAENEAIKYGLSAGMLEGITEFIPFHYGFKLLTGPAKGMIKTLAKQGTAKAIKTYGVTALKGYITNAMEEVVINPALKGLESGITGEKFPIFGVGGVFDPVEAVDSAIGGASLSALYSILGLPRFTINTATQASIKKSFEQAKAEAVKALKTTAGQKAFQELVMQPGELKSGSEGMFESAPEIVAMPTQEETAPVAEKQKTSARSDIVIPDVLYHGTEGENIGVHYGDLGKADSLEIMSGRGTGHFGTGTYFFGREDSAGAKDYSAKRKKHIISFDEYNLYKPASKEDGMSLHQTLKNINDISLTKDIDSHVIEKALRGELNHEAIEDIVFRKYPAEGIDFSNPDNPVVINRAKDMNALEASLERFARKTNDAKKEIAMRFGLSEADAVKKIKELITYGNTVLAKTQQGESTKSDSPSTKLMKDQGYEGVDVRHIKGLDNSEYGSVIYDIRPIPQAAPKADQATPQATEQVGEQVKEDTNAIWKIKKSDYIELEEKRQLEQEMQLDYIENARKAGKTFEEIGQELGIPTEEVRRKYVSLVEDEVADVDEYTFEEMHYNSVKNAMAEGKDVPKEVLDDYPDLVSTPPKPQSKEPVDVTEIVSRDDIPFETAKRAYDAISFDPDKRARQEQDSYVASMEEIYDEASKYAITPEQKTLLNGLFEQYKKDYLNKYMPILAAKSRTMSVMITGRGNFPTARNQKALEVENKRREEFLAWKKKADKTLVDKMKGARSPEEQSAENIAKINKTTEKKIAETAAAIIAVHKGIEAYDLSLIRAGLGRWIKQLPNAKNQSVIDYAFDLIRQVQQKNGIVLFAPNNKIWELEAKKETPPRTQAEETVLQVDALRNAFLPKAPNRIVAQKLITEMAALGVDTGDSEAALEQYNDIVRADYDNVEDYNADKKDAWNEFVDTVKDMDVVAEEEVAEPVAAKEPVTEKPVAEEPAPKPVEAEPKKAEGEPKTPTEEVVDEVTEGEAGLPEPGGSIGKSALSKVGKELYDVIETNIDMDTYELMKLFEIPTADKGGLDYLQRITILERVLNGLKKDTKAIKVAIPNDGVLTVSNDIGVAAETLDKINIKPVGRLPAAIEAAVRTSERMAAFEENGQTYVANEFMVMKVDEPTYRNIKKIYPFIEKQKGLPSYAESLFGTDKDGSLIESSPVLVKGEKGSMYVFDTDNVKADKWGQLALNQKLVDVFNVNGNRFYNIVDDPFVFVYDANGLSPKHIEGVIMKIKPGRIIDTKTISKDTRPVKKSFWSSPPKAKTAKKKPVQASITKGQTDFTPDLADESDDVQQSIFSFPATPAQAAKKAMGTITNPVKASDVESFVSKFFDVPIGKKKFRERAHGIFKVKAEVIRLKKTKNLPVLFHELGHLLDKRLSLSPTLTTPALKSEMNSLGLPASRPSYTKAEVLAEGIAEFTRLYVTDNQTAKKVAPAFYSMFRSKTAADSDMQTALDYTISAYENIRNQTPEQIVFGNISTKEKKGDGAPLMTIITYMLDDLYPVKSVVRELMADNPQKTLRASKNPYDIMRLLRGVAGRAMTSLEDGILNEKLEKVHESFADILEDVDNLDLFRSYLVANRVVELSKRKIETGVDLLAARNTIKNYDAKYAPIAKRLYEFQNTILYQLVDAGMLSKEAYAKMVKLNQYYVPFNRVMETIKSYGKKKGIEAAQIIGKIAGSTRDIIDPLESIIKNTFLISEMAGRNQAMGTLVNLAQDFEATGKYFDKVPVPVKPETITADKLAEMLGKFGADEDQIADFFDAFDMDDFITLFTPTKYGASENIVTYFKDGKPEYYEVFDKNLYKALLSLDKPASTLLTRIASFPTKLLRAGATLTPDFVVRNPTRDAMTAFLFSKYRFVPGFDTTRGLFHMLKKDDMYYKYLSSGAAQSSFVSMDRNYLQKELRQLLNRSMKDKTLSVIKHPIALMQAISEWTEGATRVSNFQIPFEELLAKGVPVEDAVVLAAMNARNASVDFGQGGILAKEINKWIPFFNASIQGSKLMYDSFRENPLKTSLGALLLSVVSLLLHVKNRKDKRYQELPDYQRDLFWILLTKDKIYRIPKPFEAGVLFGSFTERAAEWIETQDSKAFDGYWESLSTAVLPGLLPAAFLPAVESGANYSVFKNQAIVPKSEQGLENWAQYSYYTSEMAKLIGKKLNISPRKIDHVIYGYGAGLARYGVDIIDVALTFAGIAEKQNMPKGDLEYYPVIKSFMIKAYAGSKSIDTFYNYYDKITKEVSTYRTKKDPTQTISKETMTKYNIIAKSPAEGAPTPIKKMAAYRKQIDGIYNSKTLAPEAKRKQIDEITEKMVDYARLIVSKIDAIK